jgi:hypothetical protein
MSGSVVDWPEFARKYPGPASGIDSFIQGCPYCTLYEYNQAFKDVSAVTADDWRSILDPARRKEWADIMKQTLKRLGWTDGGHIDATGGTASIGIVLMEEHKWEIDQAVLLAQSLVGMVGKLGCTEARVLLGFQSPDFASNFPRFRAGFVDILREHKDKSLWKALGKISESQWSSVLKQAYDEKGVGPLTQKMADAIAAAVAVVAIAAGVASLVCAIIALAFAAFANLFGAVIFGILAIIFLVISIGCDIAILILLLKHSKDEEIIELNAVQGLVCNGYWTPDPA